MTAPIIGPRTMEQLESQLGAVDVQLDAALLDRIDEIVPPGTHVHARRRRVDTSGGRRRITPPPLAMTDTPGEGSASCARNVLRSE